MPRNAQRIASWMVFFSLAAAAADGPPDEPSTPKQLTNSIGMTFIRVEPGRFEMGSTEGDFDERPVHAVTLTRPLDVAVTEVTNAQYERFAPEHHKLRGHQGLSRDDDEAVLFVSWHEAMAFCQWLSREEGQPYRLPTEAEWEYFARAGTTTAFWTGQTLPKEHHKHQKTEWEPFAVRLDAGKTPANPWGLCDVHGNVEEWCLDWYGPYAAEEQVNPVGPTDGDFRVTRGGSHGTPVAFLRSANRLGTLPEDRSHVIGFRVVRGELPGSRPAPPRPVARWAEEVSPSPHDFADGPDPGRPYFRGPREYVKVPPGSRGPLFSEHNHQPAIATCPNGDLFAIWYTCEDEPGRELAVAASRLRRGRDDWEPASPFWDAPDRNDHGNALWWDGQATLCHFNGLGTDATWGKLALVLRTSTDNGATWSKARLIDPRHGLRHQVIAGAFRAPDGPIVLACDAVTGGAGGSAIHLSHDGGQTWIDPGEGRPRPEFAAGKTGAWIAGIHAGVAPLGDGRLVALGRGDPIDQTMPKSLSGDLGRNWTYAASGLPPLASGQRLVLRRLAEGPLVLASFAKEMTLRDANGKDQKVSGLFVALSDDEGNTWPVRRLVTDGGPARRLDGGGNTGEFTLSPSTAEPRGYLAACQSPDGVIHLITSKQHYAFNLAWIREPMPAERR